MGLFSINNYLEYRIIFCMENEIQLKFRVEAIGMVKFSQI